jgi:hypothetical protein
MRPGLDLGVIRYTCRARSLPEASQEAGTCPFTSGSASVLVVACLSPICAAGVTSSASASAGEVVTSGFLRLRARAATALAAAASIEMPASLRQRRRGGFAGSSRCAAEDSMAETLGATPSCRTCPVRSTVGVAQARVLCARRLAAAPVFLASGFTRAAADFTRAAAWRARSRPLLAALSASSFLVMRDIGTSASVLSLDTLPPTGHVNHLEAAAKALGVRISVAVSRSFNMFRALQRWLFPALSGHNRRLPASNVCPPVSRRPAGRSPVLALLPARWQAREPDDQPGGSTSRTGNPETGPPSHGPRKIARVPLGNLKADSYRFKDRDRHRVLSASANG